MEGVTSFGNIAFSGFAKELLADLRDKRISFQEFMRKCAYWALQDGFDELKPYHPPNEPDSDAYRDYSRMLPKERQKVDASFFVKHQEVMEYYQKVFFVKHKNKATKEWLEEILSYLPADDVVSCQKVKNRLKEFVIDDGLGVLKSTFDAEELPAQSGT